MPKYSPTASNQRGPSLLHPLTAASHSYTCWEALIVGKPVPSLSCLFFWYWVIWATCIFWRLILCQLIHLLLFFSQEATHSHWLADAKCQHLVSTGTTLKNHSSSRIRISWVLSWSITSLSSIHFSYFPTCYSSKSTLWSTSDHSGPLFPWDQV